MLLLLNLKQQPIWKLFLFCFIFQNLYLLSATFSTKFLFLFSLFRSFSFIVCIFVCFCYSIDNIAIYTYCLPFQHIYVGISFFCYASSAELKKMNKWCLKKKKFDCAFLPMYSIFFLVPNENTKKNERKYFCLIANKSKGKNVREHRTRRIHFLYEYLLFSFTKWKVCEFSVSYEICLESYEQGKEQI